MSRAGIEPVGSSPLTRGKLSNGLRSPSRPRLIPAHAGKTEKAGIPAQLGSAHPRSRGENAAPTGTPRGSQGSSPLTRGKPSVQVVVLGSQGLIPAHAGKTFCVFLFLNYEGAHPRSRGENLSTQQKPLARSGSSPLTRGKLPEPGDTMKQHRLIPAHAGKTRMTSLGMLSRTAHPRSRGENRTGRRRPTR